MSSQEALNCAGLRSNFEHREALFVEKGVLRVRVSDIRADLAERSIHARIATIRTFGLMGAGRFARQPSGSIGAGYLTTFSPDAWHMGYGGWTLFFAPAIIKGVVDLAAGWAENLDAFDRYQSAMRWLAEQHAYDEPGKRVFDDRK